MRQRAQLLAHCRPVAFRNDLTAGYLIILLARMQIQTAKRRWSLSLPTLGQQQQLPVLLLRCSLVHIHKKVGRGHCRPTPLARAIPLPLPRRSTSLLNHLKLRMRQTRQLIRWRRGLPGVGQRCGRSTRSAPARIIPLPPRTSRSPRNHRKRRSYQRRWSWLRRCSLARQLVEVKCRLSFAACQDPPTTSQKIGDETNKLPETACAAEEVWLPSIHRKRSEDCQSGCG